MRILSKIRFYYEVMKSKFSQNQDSFDYMHPTRRADGSIDIDLEYWQNREKYENSNVMDPITGLRY